MNAAQRTKRREPGGREVGPREVLGLRWIASSQPTTTGQYMTYLGMERSIAWRSLARLRDHGLVRVHVDRLDAENRYTLTREGSAHLARTLGGSPEDYRVPRGAGDVGPHHSAAVDVATALSVALAKSKQLRLKRFYFEAELRERVGDLRGSLVPDAALVASNADGLERAYAVEIDLSTEHTPYVVKHKFVPYRDLALARRPLVGVSDWRLLVVASTRRRLDTLADGAWMVGGAEVPEGLVYFGLHRELTPRVVLTADAWRTPRVTEDAPEGQLVVESPFVAARADCSFRASSLAREMPAMEAGSGLTPLPRFRSGRTG